MAQNAFGFPIASVNEVSIDRAFGPPLQAAGNLSYLEFISIVKLLWENIHPDIPIVPTQPAQYATYPCIVYGLELRKSHSTEPKPRSRNVVEKDIMVFGQRFQNVVSFTVCNKMMGGASKSSDSNQLAARYDGADVADALAELFEDFMLEYTPVFKRLGASEFVYARRLADSEENKNNTDIVKRTITYMLTTEKLLVSSVAQIEKIAIDIRLYMAHEKELVIEPLEKSTPDYTGTEVSIVDLYQGATPNS
jgi:hypothetical protein